VLQENPSKHAKTQTVIPATFLLLNKTLWVRLQIKTVSVMSVHLLIERSYKICLRSDLPNHTASLIPAQPPLDQKMRELKMILWDKINSHYLC